MLPVGAMPAGSKIVYKGEIAMTTVTAILFAVFLALCVVNLVGLQKDDVKINKITKPLLMPLLALTYWFAVRGTGCFELYLVIGLLCGFLGDTFLLGTSDKLFTCGLLAFLVGHIFYILTYHGSFTLDAMTPVGIIVPAVVYALLLWQIVKRLFPSLKKTDKPGVIVYMIVILLMSFTALQLALATGNWRPFAGSLLFVASDTMLAFQNFKFRPTPFSRVAVMSTYLLAQMLIAFGFTVK